MCPANKPYLNEFGHLLFFQTVNVLLISFPCIIYFVILGLSRHVPFELLFGNTIFLCPIFDKLIPELIPGSSVIVLLWSPNRGHPSQASVGEVFDIAIL